MRGPVAGYRQPTLADELRDAREILAAAGISYHFEDDALASWHFPPAIEAVLAWALREGITNVIRHSRARSCRVGLSADGATAQLEIRDDGTTPTSMQTPTYRVGSGLRGIAERVAALGGTYESGSLADGGFRLAVSLPLGGGQPSADVPSESASPAPSPAFTAPAIATEGTPSRGDATH